MTIYLSLLVALIGLVMYALSSNGKVVRIGEILFFTGALAFLLGFPAYAQHVVRLP